MMPLVHITVWCHFCPRDFALSVFGEVWRVWLWKTNSLFYLCVCNSVPRGSTMLLCQIVAVVCSCQDSRVLPIGAEKILL